MGGHLDVVVCDDFFLCGVVLSWDVNEMGPRIDIKGWESEGRKSNGGHIICGPELIRKGNPDMRDIHPPLSM